ncbi:hypothetical protein KP509_02G095400 [Ceratopteris richardii]|nr:hypothetical protein KP509_02G095400 [Ceratopteris richardii]
MPYYCKGTNAGSDDEDEVLHNGCKSVDCELSNEITQETMMGACNLDSKSKRILFNSLSREELKQLIQKIELAYNLHCTDKFQLSMKHPSACLKWISADIDRRIPYQRKHIVQQASMLGNMESFGLLQRTKICDVSGLKESLDEESDPVFIEFGAGRGYLSHMLADCYNIQNIMLIERRSYKFKADRTLREKAAIELKRVRIDIEDLYLKGMNALRDHHYIAFSKHLCGHATDLTLRCCRPDLASQSICHLDGIAIATCCHHICQWRPYVNKQFFKKLGFSKKEFHILTWLTSGAVAGIKSNSDNSANQSNLDLFQTEVNDEHDTQSFAKTENSTTDPEEQFHGVSLWLTSLVDRAELGRKCKQLLDVGRLYWLQESGMSAELITYVSADITPENTLLLAKPVK